ncbi:MAG: 50S ribosomal protein L3 [Candidatus Falkowbacteria bacterium]
MKFALAKKIEMTEVWRNEIVVPVTKVKVEPGTVVQVKNQTKDGYTAVVVGFGLRKPKNINKPQLGQMKDLGNFRYLKEFRYKLDRNQAEKAEFEQLTRGGKIDLTTFETGDEVSVTGTSKGRGFQGVVKRHRFHGQNRTHGNKDQSRMPGSVGAGEPQHVFKGTRMGGRMGGKSATVSNLEIVEIDATDQTMLIKGALPGCRNSVLYICGRGALSLASAEIIEPEVEEVVETTETEPTEEVSAETTETPATNVESK